jgi:hypothetical protein
MTIKRKFSATLLAGVLACETTASFADCRLGDLTGNWSHHVELTSPGGSTTIVCEDVSFSSAGSAPARYDIFGFCKLYSPNNPDGTNLAFAGGSGTELDELRSCKLTGTYNVGFEALGGIIFTVTILDARIEDNGTTAKTHIHGIAHFNSGQENVMNFTFTR